MKRKNINSTIKALQTFRVVTLIAFFLTTITSCRKLVEADPPKDSLVTESVFITDPESAIKGLYASISSSGAFGGFASSGMFYALRTHTAWASDEFDNYMNYFLYDEFSNNALTPANSVMSNGWSELYNLIYQANLLLEGLPRSADILTTAKINQFTGEIKFLRAMCYFYLVNLWGDVPLVLTTNYEQNRVVSRTPSAEVYAQIVQDLKDAQNLMVSDYSYSGGERVRANKWAATALLSRVYLFTGEWEKAETEATSVMGGSFSLLTNLNDVFLKSSNEAILQFLPVKPGYNSVFFNTEDGRDFILVAVPDRHALTNYLVNAFEPGDQRRTSWVGSITVSGDTYYYPYKYKVRDPNTSGTLTEYYVAIRLGEIYLNRAEARAQRGNIAGAQADINAIRNRAGLANTTVATQAELLLAIEQERRVELFLEWGSHRWLDLKRWNRATAVLSPIKSQWTSTAVLWPIPQQDLDRNPNLTQNPGY